MPIQIIVTDLDNTLLRRDKTISDYTVSVFARLRERGIRTAFATSRSMSTSARFRERIAPDICITSCGAIATIEGRTLFKAAMDSGTATSIIRDCKASGGVLEITADIEEYYFCSKPVDPTWEGWIDYSKAIITDFSEPLPDVLKITLNAVNPENIYGIVARYPCVDILHFSGEDWYQIKSCGASKEQALTTVCQDLKVSLSDVVAFGDDYNDVELLRLVHNNGGVAVAAGNAIEVCKAAANCLCGDCEEDGVAKWLAENVL